MRFVLCGKIVGNKKMNALERAGYLAVLALFGGIPVDMLNVQDSV